MSDIEYVVNFGKHPNINDKGALREKLVRCRDCTYLNIVGKCPCGFWALENLDGFCAWGERKEVRE